MTIVLTSQGTDRGSRIDPRFGRARYLLVYHEDGDRFEVVDNIAGVEASHGAGPQTAQRVAQVQAEVVITGNGPGGKAAAVLQAAGVRVCVGAGEMTVDEALAAYRRGELRVG